MLSGEGGSGFASSAFQFYRIILCTFQFFNFPRTIFVHFPIFPWNHQKDIPSIPIHIGKADFGKCFCLFLDIMIKVKTSAFWVCVSIKVLNKNSNPMIHITLNIWESPSNIWMDAADSSSINQQPRLASILDEIKKETSRQAARGKERKSFLKNFLFRRLKTVVSSILR